MKEAGLWVMLSVLVFQTLLPGQDELPFEFSAELKQRKEANFEERFKGSYGINAYLEPEMDVDNFNVYEGVLAFLDNREGAISYLINGMTALEEQEVEVSASLNFLLANFHFENKDYTAASEQYIKAIHKHPNFLRAYENLGYGFMFEEENEKALPVLLKAIELGSNDSQIHGLIGFLYLEKELYLSALSAYELAMLFNPRNNAWRFGILQCLINLYRREAALGVAEEILLFDPDNPRNWQNIANLLMRMDRDEEAATHLEVMHQLGCETYESRRLLGNLYMSREDVVSAKREFLAMIQLMESQAQLEDVLNACEGLLYYHLANEALVLIAKLKERSASLGLMLEPAALGLIEGIVYLQQDEFIEARKRLLQVLETEPGNGQALLSLGDVYLRLADWDQATIYFELAQMYPDFAYDALYSHAQLLLGLGQTEDALEKLREANGMEGHGDLTELIRSIEETGRLLR